MNITGLYIHVPFCSSKCDYCGFYSIVPKENYFKDRYLNHLEKTLQSRLCSQYLPKNIKTIFVGGGNPTMLGLNGTRRIVEVIFDSVDMSQIEEVTFETNPETLTKDIIDFLSEIPKIRISVGIQRLQDSELELLGRRARINSVISALDNAFSKIENISADFIMGVPNCPSIASDLRKIINDYPFKHISAYFLTIEEGTVMQRKVYEHKLQDPNDIGPEEMFDVMAVLKSAGFEHYEISNYAKTGYRCKHNLAYWESEDYIGFGPGAVSCMDSMRYCEVADFEKWLMEVPPSKEVLTAKDRRNEYLMLHMRLLSDGLNLDLFERKFGLQNEEFYINLNKHISLGEVFLDGRTLKLTKLGIIMANSVISDLFI